MAATVKYPPILNIRFSADDWRFFDDQSEKRGLLKAFVALMAVERVIDVSTRIGNVTKLSDLLGPAVETAIDVAADNWEDAVQPLMNVMLSQCMADTQLHLHGRYMIMGKPLKAPTGNARNFFVQLASYYTNLRNQL